MEAIAGIQGNSPATLARRVLLVAGGLVVLAALAAGGYLLAMSRGHDLEHARALGVRVGLEQGASEGRDEGYSRGFAAGFDLGFGPGFVEGYKRAYVEQFELADLKPPDRVTVASDEIPGQ